MNSEAQPTQPEPVRPSRRRSKPKFEIPLETGAGPASGWVYRAADVTPPKPTVSAPPAEPAPAPEPGPLLNAGIGLFAFSFATLGRTCLATVGLLTAPIRLTRRLFISE